MKIKNVIPVCSESLGVRSLAVYVETDDAKIFVDPSAELGMRYSLPPSEEEYEMLSYFKYKIRELAEKCDVLTISHYHFDHYDPEEDFYSGKKVYAKSIEKNINKSQHSRGMEFNEIFRNRCDLIYADDTKHKIGNTTIKFSKPFAHGQEGTSLGFVLMTTIEENFKFLHTSDIGGAVQDSAKDYIISESPDLIVMDGIASYFLGFRLSKDAIEKSRKNINEMLDKTNSEIILDHHLLRDLKYKKYFSEIYETGRVKTFAEYNGVENNMLEAKRKELYKKHSSVD